MTKFDQAKAAGEQYARERIECEHPLRYQQIVPVASEITAEMIRNINALPENTTLEYRRICNVCAKELKNGEWL